MLRCCLAKFGCTSSDNLPSLRIQTTPRYTQTLQHSFVCAAEDHVRALVACNLSVAPGRGGRPIRIVRGTIGRGLFLNFESVRQQSDATCRPGTAAHTTLSFAHPLSMRKGIELLNVQVSATCIRSSKRTASA